MNRHLLPATNRPSETTSAAKVVSPTTRIHLSTFIEWVCRNSGLRAYQYPCSTDAHVCILVGVRCAILRRARSCRATVASPAFGDEGLIWRKPAPPCGWRRPAGGRQRVRPAPSASWTRARRLPMGAPTRCSAGRHDIGPRDDADHRAPVDHRQTSKPPIQHQEGRFLDAPFRRGCHGRRGQDLRPPPPPRRAWCGRMSHSLTTAARLPAPSTGMWRMVDHSIASRPGRRGVVLIEADGLPTIDERRVSGCHSFVTGAELPSPLMSRYWRARAHHQQIGVKVVQYGAPRR